MDHSVVWSVVIEIGLGLAFAGGIVAVIIIEAINEQRR